jgi:hypothetical protein
MENEILIMIPDSWMDLDQNLTDCNVEVAINRIAMIISGEPAVMQKDGYRWSLDRGNDWWADYHREHQAIVIAYRYATVGDRRMGALRTVICWRLGIQNTFKNIVDKNESVV